MNDFKRLLDDESTDAARAELLEFARREGPSPDGRAKILAALSAHTGLAGLDPTGGSAPAATSPASVAPPAAAAAAVPHAVAPLKWAFIGLAAVTVPLAAWLVYRGTQLPSAPAIEETPRPVASAVAPEPAQERDSPKPAVSVTRVEDLPVVPGSAQTRAAPSASSGPSLADEVRALGRAKAALSGGNPGRALRELDSYAKAFPNGKLRQEAAVTRIEALVQSGDLASARRLGQRFLTRSGKSPYAARVRSLIGE